MGLAISLEYSENILSRFTLASSTSFLADLNPPSLIRAPPAGFHVGILEKLADSRSLRPSCALLSFSMLEFMSVYVSLFGGAVDADGKSKDGKLGKGGPLGFFFIGMPKSSTSG